MKRYPKYKDSRIDWLGEIPEHWDIIRIKRLSPVKRGASPRPIDNPKYFDDNGEFAWVRIADVTASNKYLLKTTQKLSKLGSSLSVKQYPDDLFISIAGSVGKPIITKIKCCIHDGFVYFTQLKINKDFIYYLFDAGQLFKGLGKFGTQLNLNTDTIGNIQIPLPPPEEQKAIAHFLDHKLEQIEQYIRNKKQLIKLLNEQKAAIINHTVTKGINPNVPMKHSGIEWLGEIPAHWDFKRLKYLVPGVTVGIVVTPAKYYVEFGIPCLRSLNISSGQIDNSDLVFISEQSNEIHRKSKIFAGDIVVVRTGQTGTAAIVTEEYDGANCIDLLIIRQSQQLLTRYLYFYLNSYATNRQVSSNSVGAIQAHYNTGTLSELWVTYPPQKEQEEIVNFINNESSKIDLAIAQIEKEIELIQEYRTTLISDAVTGKIDVRGFDNGSNSRNSPKPPELATM
jgi:type I restriction enzyme S subunit